MAITKPIRLWTSFEAGLALTVTQAPGGEHSHDGDLYYGWDFAAASGSLLGAAVLAVADGTVVFVEESVPDGDAASGSFGDETTERDPSLGMAGALGNVVTLRHEVDGQLFYSSYLHLAQHSVPLGEGDTVAAGQAIGHVGNTGVRTGTHLHLNVGETLGNYTNGAGQEFPAYQIAEGPDDGGTLLALIDFEDSPDADGQLDSGDVFTSSGAVPDLPTEITRVSVASDGTEANSSSGFSSISADGRFVAFNSRASNLVDGDTNLADDTFVYDRLTGTIERVSIASDGTQGNRESQFSPSISDDGRFVAFGSVATNLVVGESITLRIPGAGDIFVHDRLSGTNEHVSVASDGTKGNDWSFRPSISADGRFVAFNSDATNLVTGDTNNARDVFLHDRLLGTTGRVSVANDGTQGNHESRVSTTASSVSGDGRYVVFDSRASNLVDGDTNDSADVFVHDSLAGTTERVSVARDGAQSNGSSHNGTISADGRFIAFESVAANLVEVDTNFRVDIFVHDRLTGTTEIVSVASDGTQADDRSSHPSISDDGRYVAFESRASNLVLGETSGFVDFYVHDRLTGMTERVSEGNEHPTAPGSILWSSISGDGRSFVFDSYASNLVEGDTNGTADIFVATNPIYGGDAVRADADSLLLEYFARQTAYGSGSIPLDGSEATGVDLLAGWRVTRIWDEGSFAAVALEKGGYHPVLAIRGTVFTDPLDWLMNTAPASVGSIEAALAWPGTDGIAAWLAANPMASLTGHSQGGSIAMNFAQRAAASDLPVGNLVTFNAAGIALQEGLEVGPGKVTHFISHGDTVSLAGRGFIPGDIVLYDLDSNIEGLGPIKYAIDVHTGHWAQAELYGHVGGFQHREVRVAETPSLTTEILNRDDFSYLNMWPGVDDEPAAFIEWIELLARVTGVDVSFADRASVEEARVGALFYSVIATWRGLDLLHGMGEAIQDAIGSGAEAAWRESQGAIDWVIGLGDGSSVDVVVDGVHTLTTPAVVLDAAEAPGETLYSSASASLFLLTDTDTKVERTGGDNVIWGLPSDFDGLRIETAAPRNDVAPFLVAAASTESAPSAFSTTDALFIYGATFTTQDIAVEQGSAILRIDYDQNETVDATVTMAGEYRLPSFVAEPGRDGTYIRYLGNATPEADAEAFEMVANGTLTIAAAALLDGDTDADGDTLTVTAVLNPVNGTVSLDDKGDADPSNDEVIFTPAPGFSGVASFDYTVSDGFGGTATAAVEVAVTEAAEATTRIAFGVFRVDTNGKKGGGALHAWSSENEVEPEWVSGPGGRGPQFDQLLALVDADGDSATGAASLAGYDRAFNLSDMLFDRAVSLRHSNDAADPVLITGSGPKGSLKTGDLTQFVRYDDERGFGLDSFGGRFFGEGWLDRGEALDFEITGGRLLAVAFTVSVRDSDRDGRPDERATIALDFDGDTLANPIRRLWGFENDALHFIEDVADGDVVRVDFVENVISINGVAAQAVGASFWSAFVDKGADNVTIGTPEDESSGLALKDLTLETDLSLV